MIRPDYVCLDLVRPATTGDGLVLRGWWVAQDAPACVVLACEHAEPAALWLGHKRADLAAAFADNPTAGTSGFLAYLRTSAGREFATLAELGDARWWFQDHRGDWRSVPASLESRSPQGFYRDQVAVATPPAAVVSAAADADDLETRVRIALAGRRSLTLRLDIVNKCNLRCVMCHYSEDDIFRRPARAVTTEQFQAWFSPLARHVHEVMLSCADEPLMSRHFTDIVRMLRRIAPHVAIRFCTNAMLMTPAIARTLVEEQVDEVLFSFDACTRATLESIRRGAQFDRVLENILRLVRTKAAAESHLPVLGVNFVMMVRNIHEAPVFVELARRVGVAKIDFRHLVNGYDRFSLHDQQLSTQPARFNHYRDAILAAANRLRLSIYLPPPLPTAYTWAPGPDEPRCSLEEFEGVAARASSEDPPSCGPLSRRDEPGEPAWPSVWELFEGAYCMRPFTEVFIRDQREVLPCPWHHKVLGTLDQQADLLEVFAGPTFAALRRNMLRAEGDPACRACPFKSQELPGERVG